jgi:hypothetical protein
LLGKAPDSAGHFELGNQIAAQNNPVGLPFVDGELPDDGLSVTNPKGRPQLLITLSLPGNLYRAVRHFGFQAVQHLVFLEIAILSRCGAAGQASAKNGANESHKLLPVSGAT